MLTSYRKARRQAKYVQWVQEGHTLRIISGEERAWYTLLPETREEEVKPFYVVDSYLFFSYLNVKMKLSENCAHYTDSASVIVSGSAFISGRSTCKVDLDPVFSCQTKEMERPDQVTESSMYRDAQKKLLDIGCSGDVDVTFRTAQVGAREREIPVEELASTTMASNCFRPGIDPNDKNYIAEARCYPTAAMKRVSDGKMVKSYHMPVSARLFTCDISDSGEEQLLEDLRKTAAYNLREGRGYDINPVDLECKMSLLPFS